MKIRRSLFLRSTALAAAILALPVSGAWAAVQSEAYLSNLSVTLIDLDPLDGLAPSISFASGLITSPLVRAGSAPLYDTHGSGLFAPLDVEIQTPTDRASATVSGPTFGADGSFRNAGMRVSALANDSGPNAFASPEAFVYAPYGGGGFTFSLSPNTQASFTATGSTSVTATVGADRQSGSAEASLFVIGVDRQSQYQTDVAYSWLGESDQPGQDATSRALQVDFVNATGGWLGGDFQATVRVDGFTGAMAPPVPEPSTWALMLLGAVAVGGVTRRRLGAAGRA